jgi:hypothetical protein
MATDELAPPQMDIDEEIIRRRARRTNRVAPTASTSRPTDIDVATKDAAWADLARRRGHPVDQRASTVMFDFSIERALT